MDDQIVLSDWGNLECTQRMEYIRNRGLHCTEIKVTSMNVRAIGRFAC